MQRGVVALLVGAAAVLVLVVVLFVKVRAPAPAPAAVPAPAEGVVAPPPAGEAAAPAAPPAIRPDPREPMAAKPAAPAEIPTPAEDRAVEAALRAGGGVPPPSDVMVTPELPADAPQEMVEKRRAVSDAYDNGEFEVALRGAAEFLRFQSGDEYIRRVATVSACALGDETSARAHYTQLNTSNQRVVRIRCERYGIHL